MITFLPYPDFVSCAKCFDSSTLLEGVEDAFKILDTIRLSTLPHRPRPTKVNTGFVNLAGGLDNNDLPLMKHPATKMWRKYRWALAAYIYALLDECDLRCLIIEGVRDRVYAAGFLPQTQVQLEKFELHQNDMHDYQPEIYSEVRVIPYWLGLSMLHSVHRGNLLERNFEHYSQFGWEEEPHSNCYWP